MSEKNSGKCHTEYNSARDLKINRNMNNLWQATRVVSCNPVNDPLFVIYLVVDSVVSSIWTMLIHFRD